MGTQRSSFEKRERDRSKKAKAAAKRDSRLNKAPGDPEDAPAESPLGEADTAAVLEAVAILHQRFEDKEIEFEEFEEMKAELMARLSVD